MKIYKISIVAMIFSLLLLNPWTERRVQASPSVSVSSVNLSTTSPFNGISAVCGSTSDITISANVSATFDSRNTCLNLGGSTKKYASGFGTLAVTASEDGGSPVTLSCSSGVCTGTLAVLSEGGPHTVTVFAQATDTESALDCRTTSTTSPTSSSSGSSKYVTDEQPPTLDIQSYSPGPVPPATIPTITAGEAITVDTQLTGGSSGTSFSLGLSAYGPATLTGAPISDTFGGPSSPNDDGQAPSKRNAVALQTSCDTPPGIYTMKLEADTKDLCGNDFSPIIKDPAKTDDGASGNDITGTFELLPAITLSDETLVLSEFPTGDYGIDQCFTSAEPKKKVVSNPGTVHVASILNVTVPEGCEATTVSGLSIKLTVPAGFSFYHTGPSPYAHVFIGEATEFNLHTGLPLTEYTSSAVTSSPVSDGSGGYYLTVDLSNIDVGSGAGVIPSSDTVFVRAHAIWASTSPAPGDGSFVFSDSATANSGDLTASSTATIISNPTCEGASNAVCVDGTFDSASCTP